MKHRDTLEAGLGELKTKFSKVDAAKQFIDQAGSLLKRMENELGAIIEEKTIKVSPDRSLLQICLTINRRLLIS